ncbi:hypothetical protein DQQ10_19690 [Pseudochryseolinea flava]|uniref:Uncharacterized protein n=2 Tax=Pseudochryseolinea flava TaxID=2059302 RepID=A0A364XY79_9BACT|nr:hypothetical protein DQQ10_19690 [Pseudochryseolinea flava]
MAEENQDPKLVPIPPTFHASDTGKPFDHCLMCNQYLLDEGTPYMIEKAVKQHPEMNVVETIFEYAMCMFCAIRMHESLSVESRERISAYFQSNVNFEKRHFDLLGQTDDIANWIGKCAVKRTPISESSEYQLVAQCEGKNLVFSAMPFALSLAAMEEMSSLLSAQSLGEIDDFIGKYFSGPPEVAALLKKKFVMV